MKSAIIKRFIIIIVLLVAYATETIAGIYVNYDVTLSASPNKTGIGKVYVEVDGSTAAIVWEESSSKTVSKDGVWVGLGGTSISQDFNVYANTEASGYEFSGWGDSATQTTSLTSGDSSNNNKLKITLTRSDGYTNSGGRYKINKTKYAIFSPIEYSISYNPGSGTVDGGNTQKYDIESTAVLRTASWTGYNLDNWKVTSETSGSWTKDNTVSVGTSLTGQYGNVTLTAQWTPISYTIKFAAGDHGSGTMGDVTYNIAGTGSTTSVPTNSFTAANGYEFSGWKVTSETSGSWTKNSPISAGTSLIGKYGDVTLTAQWTPITYTIKFAPGEHGSGTMSDATYNIAGTGSITSVPTSSFTAANGYEFSGWKVSSASDGSWTQNNPVSAGTSLTGKYGDVTLTAQWTPIEYTISFSGNGGTGTDPAQIPYTIESTGVTLPANPYTKTGYSFTGWQPASNVGNWATSETYAAGATVSAGKYGNVTLQAKWDEMVDIVISVTGLQSGESAIFTVAKGSTTLYTVALNSTKSSLTINDQEPGEYTVTPQSWSWTYSMSSPITKTITSSDHTFEFTATKNTSSKKHDEKSNVNWHTP